MNKALVLLFLFFIWEVADYVGDSFGLAQRAAEAPQKIMIMCGVRFMAYSSRSLLPKKM